MPGFSPSMKLKNDPNKSVLAVLKKHGKEDIFDDVDRWLAGLLLGLSCRVAWWATWSTLSRTTIIRPVLSTLNPASITTQASTTVGTQVTGVGTLTRTTGILTVASATTDQQLT